MLRNAGRAGPRQKKDIQSIQSKIRRFGIKQQKLHRERVIYLLMDVGAADKAAIQLVKVQPYQLLVSDT